MNIEGLLLKDLGLLIMRLGIGLIFIKHGYIKLLGGVESWRWLGQQMAFVGIHFFPVVWGFLAMGVELLGGICLLIGFYTRLASFFLAFIMVIATIYHVANHNDWTKVSFPLCLLVVFLGLLVAGAGYYSIDYLLKK